MRSKKVWNSGRSFKDLLKADSRVASVLNREELEELFDLKRSIRHVDYIFARVGLA